ncbi:MAG: RagB/SusD family nutrient uptake outer membrane protein [Lewinellaceae bacterium]|nr:RagB/SusD family nutrient uptake outer membrane protein [Saprospiraceae bacterium]MCB0542461.1 RagB/SusD family nutrient uptake outer membrane protein [Saprospiraceae bacterium]MCB9307371.1 RagB/SusD family nutrient uptake outer membrane protein [Lewinellaceae bacterium]MCB9354705.1 RagB/SusD family nutrient uptake outer membrane protein [Lewinellaceae bacterium]
MKNARIFKYKAILTLLLAAGAISSCKKDFLDRKPLGELTYDTFFQTEDQAVQATNAVYNQFRSWECVALGYIGITDIISDDADKGSTLNDQPLLADIDNFNFDAANTFFSQVWTGYYRAITRANLAIKRIPDVPDMDDNLRKRLVGECKFMRAYSYFLLVQWFGDIPVITEPLSADEYYNRVRQPVAEVYGQIERDLLDAIDALPKKSQYAASDKGRITKGAAQGILAKLYMLKKQYGQASQLCLDVINSNEYSLLPKYADNFLPVGENGAESMFEINAAALQPDAGGVIGPGATPYNMVQGVRGNPNLGWGFNRPSDNLVTSYENGDPRREATVIYVGEILPDGATQVQDNPDIVNERFNQKAWVPSHPGLQDNGPGNIRVLRYSDILLLAAEALNEDNKPGDALIYLNQVRKRARGTNNFILPDITITDQAQLRERIYKERRSELAMEQHRWFDLLRWGRVADVMQAVGKNFVPNKHELLPIPQTEIDLTDGSIQQNPNY